jgi:hypothetical protein
MQSYSRYHFTMTNRSQFVFSGAALFLCATSVRPQANGTSPTAIEKEPHHSLAFENDLVRVFHLQLQPNEATKIHRHTSFYAYFSLRPVTISNEVAGNIQSLRSLNRENCEHRRADSMFPNGINPRNRPIYSLFNR